MHNIMASLIHFLLIHRLYEVILCILLYFYCDFMFVLVTLALFHCFILFVSNTLCVHTW